MTVKLKGLYGMCDRVVERVKSAKVEPDGYIVIDFEDDAYGCITGTRYYSDEMYIEEITA